MTKSDRERRTILRLRNIMQSGASARVNALACTGASSNCCDGVVAEGIPASGVAEEIRPGSCLIGPSVFN